MYGYIYKTTNLVNGKIYIGQKKSSKFLGNKYLGSGKFLKRAINKYGKDSFEVQLLEWCDSKSVLDKKERYWIKTFKSKDSKIGYNLADGGEGSNGGGFRSHKHSEETKHKISNSISKYNKDHRVGIPMTQICGENYVNGMKGKDPINKGKIKIFNEELCIVKYIKNEEELIKYPGYRLGGPTSKDIDFDYLKNPEYKKQLKERFEGTTFIHNDNLKLCKRIKKADTESFLLKGWILGRKIYK